MAMRYLIENLVLLLPLLLLSAAHLAAVIDLSSDQELIPLSQVPRLPFMPRPRQGKKMAVSTIFRWAQRGIGGVKLEVIRVGGTQCTTVQALQDFFQATAAGVATTTQQPSPKRQQELARVARELDANHI